MVARSGVASTENNFEVVPLVPEEAKIALWTRIFLYLRKIVKLKRSWHVRGEALKFYHARRRALNEEIDRELTQGTAQGSRDGLQR